MTDNEIMLFSNEEFGEVRSVLIGDEPWFVGKDVAIALGYKDTKNALKDHVDEEDKLRWRIATSGQNREMTVINESGVYSLILQSKLPSARAFKRWVTSDILPAIRKHGVYAAPETLEKALLDPEFAIRVFTELKAERERRINAENETKQLAQENIALAAENSEMKPKASYYDKILQSKSTVPITQIAKDYGMSGAAFNQMLRTYEVQYPLRDTWVLFAKYADQGYTKSKTYVLSEDKSVVHTYWTQKGRKFIYEFLKERGLLPLCERDDLCE